MEDELQIALGEAFAGVADRLPRPLVPQHHRAAAVIALGDGALEVAIVERVVLDMDREALLLGIEARPIGHRPRHQHAVALEAEIEMHPRRVVFLDQVAVTGLRSVGNAAAGLGGAGKIAFGAIGCEAVGHALNLTRRERTAME